jgi:hypothetical protein
MIEKTPKPDLDPIFPLARGEFKEVFKGMDVAEAISYFTEQMRRVGQDVEDVALQNQEIDTDFKNCVDAETPEAMYQSLFMVLKRGGFTKGEIKEFYFHITAPDAVGLGLASPSPQDRIDLKNLVVDTLEEVFGKTQH